MKKRDLIIYRIVTILFTLLMLMGVSQYFFNYDMTSETVESIQYPTYIIYPLGIAKTLGIIAIWTNKSKVLKEWAYAGFVFVFLLAMSAHLNVNDGGFFGPVMALILVITSRIYNGKVYAHASS